MTICLQDKVNGSGREQCTQCSSKVSWQHLFILWWRGDRFILYKQHHTTSMLSESRWSRWWC